MPMQLDLGRLNDGEGIATTLIAHSAKWHKSCRLMFSLQTLQRLQQKWSTIERQTIPMTRHTRFSHCHTKHTVPVCFFCDQPAGSVGLHAASTHQIDMNVRKCALELKDTDLLAKLAPGDMIALEAKYHRNCLRDLYNKSRLAGGNEQPGEDACMHGIAFAELVAFMEDMCSEDCAPVFKLADMAHLYKVRLEQLGGTVDIRIHSTRLKLRLLSVFPELRAHSQGRDILLTFEKDIGTALLKACDHDNDALHLLRAAQVVRREMFNVKFRFSGSFQAGCQQGSVPPSLLALVKMIQDGANIKHQTQLANTATTTASLSISQLMVFNSVKHARQETTTSVRHIRDRETPLPLYLAMKIHAVTRKKGLIDTLYSLGLCVSYDRLLQLTSDITNGVCQRFHIEDVVCPPTTRQGLFTTGAVDNIDHNPSSATAKDSFHGTSISLIQHPSHEFAGHDRGVLIINQTSPSVRSATHLPSSYTNVPPATMKGKKFTSPPIQCSARPPNLQLLETALDDEYKWLKAVVTALQKPSLDMGDWVSWSAHHAAIQQALIPPPAINALLPLFLDKAHSVAMIRHSMNIVKAAVQHLNPGQVPVLAADQPLFALAKEIQWAWPETHGEDQFVIMFGGLHIEMGILRLLGTWLEDSGWTNVLVQADIASSGTADSFIRASHVTKTRHAHQVTAASLYTLLQQAHHKSSDALPFEEWCCQQARASVHFQYWFKTLSLELLLLTYIRSLREGNFELYVESLVQIMPWMFALDHTHYSRWLSVHIRDMMMLVEKHPDLLAEFKSGKFVVNKTSNKFSAMAIDQCHEQNNAVIKASGGAVGLTENPGALRRWMVAGPEIARITGEFEDQAMELRNVHIMEPRHHDQQPGVQAAFLKEVRSLIAVVDDMGNPFLEEIDDLLVLDTRDIMDTTVAETVRNIEAIGKEQYEQFVSERLEMSTKAVTDTIPKNKLPLFSCPPLKIPSRQKIVLTALKNDLNLFSRLYISCQTRDGDLDEFFSHENHAAPPSLSSGGKLRLGVKADLLHCLTKSEETGSRSAVEVDVIVLDGAAVVQMMKTETARTFQEFSNQVFSPYISSQLDKAQRVDVVWDVYLPDSLKSTTRQRRGKGVRRRVTSSTIMPKNWKDFLRVDQNKMELFRFLSQEIISMPVENGKELYATDRQGVLCYPSQLDLTYLVPCSQEEADTRILLHVADAVRKGKSKVAIRTVDTDVVVLAVALFNKIKPAELWVAFGAGSNFRYIAVHEVVTMMNPRTCASLPIFHAITGCDTVSSFAGRGKKSAWETWRCFPEVTDAFEQLSQMSTDISEQAMSLLERFVVLLYDRTSEIMAVNDARKQLFTQKSRALENLPPTQAALEQHIKRANYQANIWNKALISSPELPNPSEWGWRKDATGWQPLWTTLQEAAKSCYELIHCGCKKGCTARCKCVKAALKCTALCSCSGDC